MILSHSYQFIFIKPRKVAGTTIELMLSPYLERGDYATPVEPHEEHLRLRKDGVIIGKIRQQNKFRLPLQLRDHSTLKKAYLILNQKVQNYFVVSACRNPWDRAVSQFFWSNRKTNIFNEPLSVQKYEFNRFTKRYGPKTLADLFYGRKKQRRLNSSHLYTINDKILANFVIRYEYLEADLSTLKKVLNLPKDIISENIKTKSNFRPIKTKNWQQFYDNDTIDLVSQCCSEEIHSFNYSFDGNTNLKGPLLTPRVI